MKTALAILLMHLLAPAGMQSSQADPFLVSIRISNNSVKLASPVAIEVTTKNTSQTPVKLSLTNPVLDYAFAVVGPDGVPVPETNELKKMKDRSKPVIFTRQITKVLQPGQSISERVQISDYYDFSKLGDYTISAQREIPEWVRAGKGNVKSNSLIVTVVPNT